MTPSDVKTVVANLDDFIELPDGIDRLRKAVLTLAVSGKLVPQNAKEGIAEVPDGAANEVIEEPFPIPKSWKWVRLDQIGSFGSGTGFPKEYQGQGTGEIPFFKVSDMNQNEKEMIRSVNWVSRATAKEMRANILPARTVIFPKIGGAIATNKRRVLITESCIDNNCLGFVPGQHLQDEWVFMLFTNIDLTKYQVGTSVPALNIGRLSSIPVALPPSAEQKRIVQKVNELMKQLDELEARRHERDEVRTRLTKSAMQALGIGNKAIGLELLSELVTAPEDVVELEKAILTLAVSGKLLSQNPKEGTGEDLYKEIQVKKKSRVPRRGKKQKDTALGPITAGEIPFGIPKSWKWVRLGELFDVQRGGSPRPIKSYLTDKPDGLNWIKIGDSEQGSQYIYSTKEKIRPDGLKKTRKVEVGDLLLTNSMSYGRPYILKTDGCIHDGWLALRPYSKDIDTDYMFYLLSSGYCQSQFDTLAAGAVVQNLNAEKVSETLVTLPPVAEQKRIVKKTAEVRALLDDLRMSIK